MDQKQIMKKIILTALLVFGVFAGVAGVYSNVVKADEIDDNPYTDWRNVPLPNNCNKTTLKFHIIGNSTAKWFRVADSVDENGNPVYREMQRTYGKSTSWGNRTGYDYGINPEGLVSVQYYGVQGGNPSSQCTN